MPYRYSPRRPPVADLRQEDGNGDDTAEVVAPPADNVDEAPEAAQEVLEKSLEPVKRKRRRSRKDVE